MCARVRFAAATSTHNAANCSDARDAQKPQSTLQQPGRADERRRWATILDALHQHRASVSQQQHQPEPEQQWNAYSPVWGARDGIYPFVDSVRLLVRDARSVHFNAWSHTNCVRVCVGEWVKMVPWDACRTGKTKNFAPAASATDIHLGRPNRNAQTHFIRWRNLWKCI